MTTTQSLEPGDLVLLGLVLGLAVFAVALRVAVALRRAARLRRLGEVPEQLPRVEPLAPVVQLRRSTAGDLFAPATPAGYGGAARWSAEVDTDGPTARIVTGGVA